MPEIEIDDEVFAAMQEEAVAFVDEPNDVLRRQFGLDPAEHGATAADGDSQSSASKEPSRKRTSPGRRRSRGRAPRGELLPGEAYEGPILKVLADRGGEAPAREATDAVEPLISDQLTELEYEKTSSGEVRWRNRTQFARLALANKELIDKEAPRGIWRLTEDGRKAAKQVQL